MAGRTLVVAAPVVAVALATAAATASATPLQRATPITATGPRPSVPAFVGHRAVGRPLTGIRPAWSNPFMAPNPTNSVHNDAWQSDAYTQYGGPLGRRPRTLSTEFGRTCITLTVDRKGRLIGSCISLNEGPALYLFDPVTLDTLAFRQLPFVPPPAGTNPALNTTGGAYFFLDHRGRAVVATTDRRILLVGTRDVRGTPRFRQVASYDPRPCLDPADRMPSALPDARGRYWFVGRTNGTVGVLDPATRRCGSVVLGEEIENSFAVASDGVYIVSDKAMYKFRAGRDLRPRRIWRAAYANTGVQKPGQINAGSGTTPTLIATRGHAGTAPQYVAITDNADPMDVVVYRSKDRLARGERRVVCTVPVFRRGASATENSLLSAGRSIFVENNHGYDLIRFNDVIAGNVAIGGDRSLVSEPGVARVDIRPDGSGCRKAWTNTTVRAPSVVPKVNTRNGLVYLYENVRDPRVPDADPWYWTAVDARSGEVVWKRLAGWGGLFNNHYAGIALGRNPATGRTTLYVGGVGGIMALRDQV